MISAMSDSFVNMLSGFASIYVLTAYAAEQETHREKGSRYIQFVPGKVISLGTGALRKRITGWGDVERLRTTYNHTNPK